MTLYNYTTLRIQVGPRGRNESTLLFVLRLGNADILLP